MGRAQRAASNHGGVIVAKGFALAGLLRLRGLQESKAAGELATANQSLRQRVDERHAMRESMTGGIDTPVDSASLLAMAATRASTRGMLVELDTLVATLDERAALAREAHQQARTEMKSLEKLADRHDLQARQEVLVREQHLLDDLGATNTFEGNKE